MRNLFFIAVACLVMPSTSSRGDEGEKEKKAKDLAVQGITDLTLLRDEVLEQYALRITGETERMNDGTSKNRKPLQIDRIYKLHAGWRAKDFTYRANCKVMDADSTSSGRELQFWSQYFQCGMQTKGKVGIVSRAGYKVREKSQSIPKFLKANRLSAVSFDPFDDLVIHPMFINNDLQQYRWIEQVFLRESKLVSAETVLQGDIRSTWNWKQHSLEFEVEMTQSKAHGYLPVSLKFKNKRKWPPGLTSETEISWKKHSRSGKYVPYVLKSSYLDMSGHGQTRHRWVFDWRIGKELDDTFFDSESEDFRTPFEELFGFTVDAFTPIGLVLGTPWETPKELVEDEGHTAVKRK